MMDVPIYPVPTFHPENAHGAKGLSLELAELMQIELKWIWKPNPARFKPSLNPHQSSTWYSTR